MLFSSNLFATKFLCFVWKLKGSECRLIDTYLYIFHSKRSKAKRCNSCVEMLSLIETVLFRFKLSRSITLVASGFSKPHPTSVMLLPSALFSSGT